MTAETAWGSMPTMRQRNPWERYSNPGVYAYERLEAEAYRKINSTADGPVTQFVRVSRALELARDAGPIVGADDPIANALYRAIGEAEIESGEFAE